MVQAPIPPGEGLRHIAPLLRRALKHAQTARAQGADRKHCALPPPPSSSACARASQWRSSIAPGLRRLRAEAPEIIRLRRPKDRFPAYI